MKAENRIYYPALDGIRALALAMVFAQHYMGMPWGYTGVDLFFVLSGFLITGILVDSADRPDRWRTFYIRRSLRIFPLYYGLLGLLLLLTPVLHFHWNRWWLVWPAYLGNIVRFIRPYDLSPGYVQAANGWLHLQGTTWVLYLGHFWSLSLEEQFYLVWPWVVFRVYRRRRLLWICIAVVLFWPLLRVLDEVLLPARYTALELNYSFTPVRIDALLWGALLALLIRGDARGNVLRACRVLLQVAAPLVLAYLLFTLRIGHPYPYPVSRLSWGQSVLDIFYTAMVGAALVPGTWLYSLCTRRPLRRIGQISYGAYVFHDIPHDLYLRGTGKLLHHVPALRPYTQEFAAVVAAAGTLLLASVSYRYIESPILRLKERWAPSEPPAAPLTVVEG